MKGLHGDSELKGGGGGEWEAVPKHQWRIVLRIYQAREAEAMKGNASENLASHERRETEPDHVAINSLSLGLRLYK